MLSGDFWIIVHTVGEEFTTALRYWYPIIPRLLTQKRADRHKDFFLEGLLNITACRNLNSDKMSCAGLVTVLQGLDYSSAVLPKLPL